MNREPHSVAVVIPVYRGAATLAAVVTELDVLTRGWTTSAGHFARVVEVVLVHDGGEDTSPTVMRQLATSWPHIRLVWLTRNFGQHAATMAGIADTTSDWVVTMDEDGQHDPGAVGDMLDVAIHEQSFVVYARSTNRPPHGAYRNAMSRTAKRMLRMLTPGAFPQDFNSFRLILGSLARSVASRAGPGVYLDVALSWVAPRPSTCDTRMRTEGRPSSGYSTRSLLGHFWRMVLTTGTRGLRIASAAGAALGLAGVGFAAFIIWQRLSGVPIPDGWPSIMSVTLIASGTILFALGVLSEYVGVSVNMSLGRPLYVTMIDPAESPLGRATRESR